MIFSRFYWNSKWSPRINFNFFVGAKTQKISQKLFTFCNHIPYDMEMCRWFFKGFAKIQNGRHRSTTIFLWAQKLKNLNYSNFAITFPTIWGCAGDFSKVLLKFKMAAMDELHFFLWAQKFKNWNQKKITFYNHITHHLEMFRWFYWNLKWPPQVDFLNICDRKNSNLIYGGEWYRTSCGPLVIYRPT